MPAHLIRELHGDRALNEMMTSATNSWTARIARADALSAGSDSSAALVRFYGRLLRGQQHVNAGLVARPPTGIEDGIERVIDTATPLLQAVAEHGPDPLRATAKEMEHGSRAQLRDVLLEYWQSRSDRLFFAKALLQPYAEWLVRDRRDVLLGVPAAGDDRCPNCGGPPQLSIIEGSPATAGGGSSRLLQCATCLTAWPFRRVHCPSCGNEDERRLGYYDAPAFPHVRVDACEACGRYLKTIDLGRRGVAVPLVDEIASAPLDVWAAERGYVKLELNLIGL